MIESKNTSQASFNWPSAVGITFCITVATLLVVMPVLRLTSLHSNFYDLGQYATYHHSMAFTGYWGAILRTHAHLLAAPYVLIYKILPGNLTLVLLQAAIVVGATPLYVAYWRRLSLPYPVCGALLYLLSISVWFSTLFDFHFEHLIFPIVFSFFLVADRSDRFRTQTITVLVGLTLCLVKEAYPLSAAMLGLYLMINKRWYVSGAILTTLSIVYFFVITLVVIPHFSDGAETGDLWKSAFGYLGNSPAEILISILKNPWTIAGDILQTPRKLVYVATLFGALAMLPLLRPVTLLPALPILAISLLSHNQNHYYLGHQYTTAVTAFALIAAAQALAPLRNPTQIRWIKLMLVGTTLSLVLFGPSPISRLFWSSHIFNYHWSSYYLDDRGHQLQSAINAFIPKNDSASVSAQNAINMDRLTDRSLAFPFPLGVFEPTSIQNQHGTAEQPKPRTTLVDYVVLDHRRPLSLSDEICTYNRVAVCNDNAFTARYNALLQRLRNDFDILYDRDDILIARRRTSN